MSEKISIVRRLRLEANALGEFQAYASREYQRLLLDAADEIERLGKERDEMQGELRKAETECSMLRVECGVIASERDEARRVYCNAMTDHCEEHEARQIAQEQGWDCFKEDDK
jgi:hypothetical protein